MVESGPLAMGGRWQTSADFRHRHIADRSELAGGCLSLVTALIGTPWEIDLRGKVFFFEDVDEAPYGIDRMLSQLLATGQLQGCAGIVIGEHANCGPKEPGNTLGLEQVTLERLRMDVALRERLIPDMAAFLRTGT